MNWEDQEYAITYNEFALKLFGWSVDVRISNWGELFLEFFYKGNRTLLAVSDSWDQEFSLFGGEKYHFWIELGDRYIISLPDFFGFHITYEYRTWNGLHKLIYDDLHGPGGSKTTWEGLDYFPSAIKEVLNCKKLRKK